MLSITTGPRRTSGLLALGALALALALPRPAAFAAEPPTSNQQHQALLDLQDAFTALAEASEPSVVGIHTDSGPPAVAAQRPGEPAPNGGNNPGFPFDLNPFGGLIPPGQTPEMAPRTEASGSGIIVRQIGDYYYILTNEHVIEDAGRIMVSVNGLSDLTRIRAEKVGKPDDKTDLAVIRVKLPPGQPADRVARLGDSDKVKVGNWAIAIGNPLDVGETLTVGVVSAVGRDIGPIDNSVTDYRDMIQTDASINPGNSGGALLNINGEVIGVNTAIASPTRGSIGIGFAIPINVAKDVVDQLIAHGEVVRGWLGVETIGTNRDISSELGQFFGVSKGAFADHVWPNSPASRAGIKDEDIITRWGATPISNFSDLERAVAATPPGRSVAVTLYRDGKPRTVTVLTEKRPSEQQLQDEMTGAHQGMPAPERKPVELPTEERLGMTVRAVVPADADTAHATSGILVLKVEPDTAAYDAGIVPGDVILRVNHTLVHALADFREAFRTVAPTDAVILRLDRLGPNGQRSPITLVVRPEPD